MLSKKEVEHIAKLARLGLTEEEKKRFQKQLSSILDYFKELQKVDTKKVAPTAHAVGASNVIREDEARKTKPEIRQKILDEAPVKEEDYVKVKRIL